MKSSILQVKGTREFYPYEMQIRKWLYSLIEQVSVSFGYQEWDGPFIEKIDLYAAKSGEELVKEQAFVFADRGGELVTLRPELTPSLARMVAKKQNELIYPLRWWSFGPFWRYEKPQKGRTREFFQWNIDMIGVNSAEADAELVAICATFLKKAGINPGQISIFVNHRKLMEQQLSDLGVPAESKKKVFQLIDHRDKLSKVEWEEKAVEIGLDKRQYTGLSELLNDKELWKQSAELVKVFEVLDSLGVREYIHYDPRIVRGLDYYTGIVFEAWDVGGEGRAVLGGGHYDNLVSDVGGEPLPGVGFAMGDVMISLLLEKYGKIPDLSLFNQAVLVTVFDDEREKLSHKVSASLRNAGFTVLCYPEVAKLQKQFKFADRAGVRFVIILGPDEAEKGTLTIKDLVQHNQVTVGEAEASRVLREMLATP